MNILTIATTRSLRETAKDKRYTKYYSLTKYEPGTVIEIIDGNKKSLALILKRESAAMHKQAIRDGSLDVKKLKLSKTGNYAQGVVVASYPMKDIRIYLKEPNKAHQTSDPILCKLFPKRRLKKKSGSERAKATLDGSMQGLSVERYTQNKPTHYNELQLFVDEVRTYFGEEARYGRGSFSYYLGFCKRIPLQELWQIFGESKQSKKSRFGQKRLFWWKIGNHIRGTDKEKK